ncbi:hypothetical protein AN641_05755 [Candidatus Epulonipiscioides gigas]|nr:hypothetical protein AN641_07880 [Epulopiscium sp. SCG-C07WGA-EpuloA2]ONI44858.1 hypothetical protein AN641_05755 [Epulopiscium sp. SCG-C07WGA-EpuloA2]
MIILNGSPRAVQSNSKEYAHMLKQYCNIESQYFNITHSNHLRLCDKMQDFKQLVLVFPLYVDSLPVTLLNFLKTLEQNSPQKQLIVSVIINCGFIEYTQNDIAIEMIKLFCKQQNYLLGSTLSIGSGEAILGTPFKRLVVAQIKQLATSLEKQDYKNFHITMPIPKKLYLKASNNYWINYGKKYGISKKQMKTLKIEDNKIQL